MNNRGKISFVLFFSENLVIAAVFSLPMSRSKDIFFSISFFNRQNMSYIVLFLLIIVGYIIGIPILRDSFEFELVECVTDENGTSLSRHILQITNFNGTCVKVNKSTTDGNEVYFYIFPETNHDAQLTIRTENCSKPFPQLHLSACDDNDVDSYPYNNMTNNGTWDDSNANDTSTMETFLYTGPTVYETLHQLDEDSDDDDDDQSTTLPSLIDKSSEENND